MYRILAIVLIILAAIAAWWFFNAAMTSETETPVPLGEIRSFEDCVAAGYPVMESYPRQCAVPDGRTYAEEIEVSATYENADETLIKVDLPYPGAVTGKEFLVTGEARGNWYFEASFPIEVIGQNGETLVSTYATAQAEWMTTDFVPFIAEIAVPQSYIGPATLVLRKDNPSGLPENDASVSFPITIEY